MQLSSLQLALLSSAFTFGGVLLAALVAGLYNLRAKRNEYINDYYKKVIERRIAAYEQLERLIIPLKTAVLGEDKKPCHFLFSVEEEEGLLPAYSLLHGITSQALWLSEDAFQKTKELDRLLWSFKRRGGGTAVEFGQQNYQALATLRENLEKVLAADMLDLHDVGRFLRKKKTSPDPGLQPWG